MVVLRDQRPVAEIKPVASLACQPRPFGLCSGQLAVPDDFDQALPDEVLREFQGR